jgi:hypothetical protein
MSNNIKLQTECSTPTELPRQAHDQEMCKLFVWPWLGHVRLNQRRERGLLFMGAVQDAHPTLQKGADGIT